MRKSFIILLFLVFTLGSSRADEGMWLLPLLEKLNINTMHQMGCELTAEDIYSINHSSLKDAIVNFGGYCSGEIISAQGLLLTNHHCGYDAIQQHSSVEHDYLTTGFWATTRDEELPTPGLSVTFLVRIEDVTDRIEPVLNPGMTEEARADSIDRISTAIAREAIAGTHYQAAVESFYSGNRFYLLVYENYPDVRMVGAPPSSIGNFGGDTDNFMWPRHTGDFSIFRVYAGQDGKPAAYSSDNVPLQPRHFLPVSLKGVEKGDYTMVIGYPAETERYLTSYGISDAVDEELPIVAKVCGERLEITKRHMDADPAIRIKYASKYASFSNYRKLTVGEIQGIKHLDVYERMLGREQRFARWVDADPSRQEKYGEALPLIKAAYEDYKDARTAGSYFNYCFVYNLELPMFVLGSDAESLLDELEKRKTDPDKVKALAAALRDEAAGFYKDYDRTVEREITEAMLKRYFSEAPQMYHPDFYKTIAKKYKGDVGRYTQDFFNKSVFADSVRLFAFLQKPSAKVLKKDPVLEMCRAIIQLSGEINSDTEEGRDKRRKGNRLYTAGIFEMGKDKVLYPDANFTMRLTYGKVNDYFPRDGVYYSYYTTMKGIMEKEDAANPEFVVPARLKELYEKKDFGRYADKNGEMPVCFISNNDITGGNSGSPVIDGKGQLVGIAFDGNWEAMSCGYAFEPDLQRSINVDIRYVLFIIDKYAGATHLIDEMKIVE